MVDIKRRFSWSSSEKEKYRFNKEENTVLKQRAFAKRLTSRIPFELKEKILERTPIIFLRDYADNRIEKHRHRFEEAYRINNQCPTWGEYTNWVKEFQSFVFSLPSEDLLINPDKNFVGVGDSRTDEEVSGQTFRHSAYGSRYAADTFLIALTLHWPLRERTEFRRIMRIIDHDIDIDRREANLFNLHLGNDHDLGTTTVDGDIALTTSFRVPFETRNIAFDDDYNVYYHIGDLFYRQNLRSFSKREHLFTLDCAFIEGFTVGNNKVFIYLDFGGPMALYCYDLCTRKMYRRFQRYIIGTYMVAHGNSCLCHVHEGDLLLFTWREDGLQKKVIPCLRKQQLNRDTYLVLVDEGGEKMVLKILYIINDKPIEHFVQYCDNKCVFKRHTDSVFVVTEPRRRHIWYQEKIGDPPYLIHKDITISDIGEYDDGYVHFRRLRTVERRNSI